MDIRKQSYFRIVLLNEIAFGQQQEFVNKTLLDLGEVLQIEYSHLNICVLGIKKRVYSPVLSVSTEEYAVVYEHFCKAAADYLNGRACSFEIFMAIYSENKELVIFFSPKGEKDQEPMEIAQTLHRLFQEIWDEKILKKHPRVFNFTALSKKVRGYKEIAAAFSETMELHALSFFIGKWAVVTEEIEQQLKKEFTYQEALEWLHNLKSAMMGGDLPQVESILRELFLEKLQYSFHFSLCVDVIIAIKKDLYQLAEAYDIDLMDDLEQVFTLKGKIDILELYERIHEVVIHCTTAVVQSGKALSYITQEALHYMKKRYNQDISLSDIAGYANVVPGYLSRVFNREMEITIPTYLSNLRVEKAKKLLQETHLRVFEIAEQVGIENATRFGQAFKKVTGITPQEFRSRSNARP